MPRSESRVIPNFQFPGSRGFVNCYCDYILLLFACHVIVVVVVLTFRELTNCSSMSSSLTCVYVPRDDACVSFSTDISGKHRIATRYCSQLAASVIHRTTTTVLDWESRNTTHSILHYFCHGEKNNILTAARLIKRADMHKLPW